MHADHIYGDSDYPWEACITYLLQMFLLFVHGVATLDRKSFGRIGAEPFHYLRLSIATGTEELKKGVERIAAGTADREGFRRFLAAGEHLF